MIIYEITATVRTDLIEKYEKYMREIHIPDLLETGFFSGAKFTRSAENRYRIQYEVKDQKDLERYLKTEANRLRAHFLENFSEGVELGRENWDVLEIWKI